ncbi:MAG: PQQ-binding-like beta-propeller repeat protein [Verrucomicrobiae bacterium]|nr:PQQ-binding-like beta-propeller repeat protein [Verrucomicrobiae bacterium]
MKTLPRSSRSPLLLFAAALAIPGHALLQAEEWTEFRGPGGQGHSEAKNLPSEWSKRNHVKWETEVPGTGWSSPVIVNGRVYLTSAVEDRSKLSLQALAFDAESGKPIWNTEVFSVDSPTKIHSKNSHASPTAIFEDGKVYVHFGHDGTACVDATSGAVIWKQSSLPYPPVHGNGGSPIIVGDKLIFSSDAASDPFIVALNKTTGEVVWKTARNVETKRTFSFSTPLAIEVNGKTQVISPASGAVISYDPETGTEIWRCLYGEGYSVVPRPVFANGLVYVCSGFNRAILYAIRPDGEGDVTKTHIAWEYSKTVPKESSILVVDDLVYLNDDKGIATCLDAKTGEVQWQERLAAGGYSASPIYADGKIYFQNGEGVGTVIRPGRKFDKIAENDIGEHGLASYGVTEGALFIRTDTKLFRIGG